MHPVVVEMVKPGWNVFWEIYRLCADKNMLLFFPHSFPTCYKEICVHILWFFLAFFPFVCICVGRPTVSSQFYSCMYLLRRSKRKKFCRTNFAVAIRGLRFSGQSEKAHEVFVIRERWKDFKRNVPTGNFFFFFSSNFTRIQKGSLLRCQKRRGGRDESA